MQPIDHSFFLFDASIPLPIIRPQLVRTKCELLPLFRGFAEICLDETTPDEQQISDLNVPALGLWPYVDALVFSACLEFGIGDAIRLVGVECDPFFLTVGLVIEQYAAACDSMIGPVMDRTFVVRIGTDDVRSVGVVVEGLCW